MNSRRKKIEQSKSEPKPELNGHNNQEKVSSSHQPSPITDWHRDEVQQLKKTSTDTGSSKTLSTLEIATAALLLTQAVNGRVIPTSSRSALSIHNSDLPTVLSTPAILPDSISIRSNPTLTFDHVALQTGDISLSPVKNDLPLQGDRKIDGARNLRTDVKALNAS